MLTLAGLKSNYVPLGTMSRLTTRSSAADRQEASSELKDYQDSVLEMTEAATIIGSQNLIVPFRTDPAWYDATCKNKLSGMKGHALLWNESILPKLISVPSTILNYDMIYRTEVSSINSYVDILLSSGLSPADRKKAEKNLLSCLESLIKGTNLQKASVDKVVSEIKSLLGSFEADKTFAKGIYDKALAEKTVNKDKVRSLQKDIDDLNRDIRKYQNMVMGGEIALGVSITVAGVGIAGMVAAVPFMWIVVLVGAAGLAASIALIVEGNKKIAADAIKIISKQNEMGDAEKDAEFCGQLSSACMNVCEALKNGIYALTGMSSLWNDLQLSMTEFTKIIATGNEQAKKMLYNDLRASLSSSDKTWGEIVTKARVLSSLKFDADTSITRKLINNNGRLTLS